MKDIGSRYNIYGNEWSQKVGWEIFPVLIQMAIEDQAPITYGELADKAEEAGKDTRQPTYYSKGQGWSDDKIKAEQAAVYNFEHWDDIKQAILQR